MTLKVCLDKVPSGTRGRNGRTGHLFKIKHYKTQLQSAQFEQL